MKMSWMGEGHAVLRFEAENEMDLEVLGALFFNGLLAGAVGRYVPLEGSPWSRSTRGLVSHIGGARLLMGLEWDIRNQPAVGRPRSDADARVGHMSQSRLAALLCMLQEAEQFITHGEETDDLRQQIAVMLRTELRQQIQAIEAALKAEVAHTGQWGDGNDPTVRPTTLEEVLNSASAEIWHAEQWMGKLTKEGPESHWWHHWQGRQIGLYVLLQRCGALPVGPVRRSNDELHRALVAVRAVLPDGFEGMPIDLAYQFLASHGVELARYETPYFQRHLVAGLRKHENAVPLDASGSGKLDGEQLAVSADLDDSANPHPEAPQGKNRAEDYAARASLKACIACKHYRRDLTCQHPDSPVVDYVRGDRKIAQWMRSEKNGNDGICGREGRLFELRQQGGAA